jgi:integrase
MQLHTADGTRKYLTAGERDAFLREAERADRPVRTLCMTLAYAGCRLSEALALTADRVDLAAGVLVFESLKKRRTGIFRSVPVPPLPCSIQSTWCTAFANCRRGAAKAAACGSGRGRG